MRIDKNSDNIAHELEYTNILLTKSLAQLVQETVDLPNFSIFGDNEDNFFIVPSEKVDSLNESAHSLAHIVGLSLFNEYPIDLEEECYMFNIEYENEDDHDYQAVLSITVEDLEIEEEEDDENEEDEGEYED